MARPIDWKPHIKKLTKLSLKIYKDKEFTKEKLIQELGIIFPEYKIVKKVDNRTIAFLEYCFYRADGPYSKNFKFFILVLRKVFYIYPPLRMLINQTGAAAIGNMVLEARGNLKFVISDYYELKEVLRAWDRMGLKHESVNSVYRAIRSKAYVKREIGDQNPLLLVRLKVIFPMYKRSFIHSDLNLNQALFEHFQVRFDSIISYYQRKGSTLEQMIQQENTRKMPAGIKRNNLLAFLVKKSNTFQCQVCNHFHKEQTQSYRIQAHHIIPLSEGGQDNSENMIVLCEKHHSDVHEEHMVIERAEKIIIKYKNKITMLD